MAGAKTSGYSEMTVNERLPESDMLTDLEAVVRIRDRGRIISVLARAALLTEDAAFTADTVPGEPWRSGH